MGVHEGMGHLSKAMKELSAHWTETKSGWADTNSREFEKKFFEPIERDLRTAVGAMDQMAVLLHQIYRDCE
jgi:hypothetical protein